MFTTRLGRSYLIIPHLTLHLQLCDECTLLLMGRRHLEEKLRSTVIDLDGLLRELCRCYVVICSTRAAIALVSQMEPEDYGCDVDVDSGLDYYHRPGYTTVRDLSESTHIPITDHMYYDVDDGCRHSKTVCSSSGF